jgi:hypothetical protein
MQFFYSIIGPHGPFGEVPVAAFGRAFRLAQSASLTVGAQHTNRKLQTSTEDVWQTRPAPAM